MFVWFCEFISMFVEIEQRYCSLYIIFSCWSTFHFICKFSFSLETEFFSLFSCRSIFVRKYGQYYPYTKIFWKPIKLSSEPFGDFTELFDDSRKVINQGRWLVYALSKKKVKSAFLWKSTCDPLIYSTVRARFDP